MTVIDLGEVTHGDAGPAIPLNHRRLLRAVLAVLTVAGVLSVAGSAHGSPPQLRPLWITQIPENGAVALDRHNAYLTRLDDGRLNLVARDLATGTERWSATAGDVPSDFPPRPAGGVVLMPTDQTAVSQKVQDGELFYVTPRTTIALDTVTGAERWRVDGDAQPVIAAGVAIVAEHDARNQIVGLRVVKLGDGATVWQLALPPLADWTPLPGWDHPEAIATIAQDGTAAVYDFADGTLRRSARLFGNDAHVVRGQTGVEPAGDNFAVVRDALEDGSVSTIYSADTMKALWQTGYVAPCGALLCSTGRGGVSGHDPATGRVIWALTGASDGWQVGENRMVVGKRDNTELQLIDSRTGRSLGRPITGMVASGSGLADELLITRPSLDPVGELVVTRVDLADGTQTPLGRFGPSGEQTVCSTSRGYLACPRYDGLHVMAVGR